MTHTDYQPPARLLLEDGSMYDGYCIGVPGTVFGELVFNTASTGYQEILTDPSYKGQIVLMTYPEIGNYGINGDDFESSKIQSAGFVVRRLCSNPSSWRAHGSLEKFMMRNGQTGIEGVDTRAVTRRIRMHGAMKAGITTADISAPEFLEQVMNQPALNQQDLVSQASTPEAYTLSQTPVRPVVDRLVVVDFGIKKSILRYLQELVHEITVVPYNATVEQILAYNPQGVLLSNGPGDPAVLHNEIALAKALIDQNLPTFGICLGHQILALASGAQVGKMPFGHHGANHPVKDLETGKIDITSQNHGYAIEKSNFPEDTLSITHLNLNDQTVAGIRHKNRPVCSVQFHPEASPGPHDSQYIFERFMREILAHTAAAC